MKLPLCLAVVSCLAMTSCQTIEPYDYTLYQEHYPVSILVLPPIDDTIEVDASSGYLSTVSLPLAELGYYVFPVAVVDRIMRENGLSDPVQMHEVPLAKLAEIFNPDAVLYVTLSKWGTKYLLLDSQTRVTASCRLVDVDTGLELWNGTKTAVHSSSQGQSGLAGMLAAALVNQIATSIVDPTRDVARQANGMLFYAEKRGLLLGAYHPEYANQTMAE